MVHHYPAAVKAFYMKRDPEREEIALGVDVLAPEGYAKSSAAASAQPLWSFCSNKSPRMACRRRLSNGIWICAAMAASPTQALAWASNAAPPGCAGLNTCVKQFHFPGCCTG